MYRHFCLALALLALPLSAVAETPRQIVVTGHGEVTARPDMATLALGVVATDPTAQGASGAMSRALRAVLSALGEAGIDDTDIQTTAIDLSPRYDAPDAERGRTGEITGFQARSTLSVIVRDLPNLGALLDTVVSQGSNRIQGITFGLQDSDARLNDARKAAVRDARAKATLYAEAAGAAVGDATAIVETAGVAQPQMQGRMMMAADAPMPIAEGEVSLTAEISVTFALED